MTSKRIPILVWGDLIENQRPVVRRSLVGERAHECMYAWVYLTDYLVAKRIAAALGGAPLSGSAFFHKLRAFAADRAIDPHYQHNLEAWTLAAIIGQYAARKAEGIEVAELGQTFFALKTKLAVLAQAYPSTATIKWTGIDNSAFAVEVAKTLHGDGDTFFDDWRKFARNAASQLSVFTSRFVSSYAFDSTAQFTEFLGKHAFDLIVLDEPFNAGKGDLRTFNHGLPITYFDLEKLNAFAQTNGYVVEIIDWYPDNPAKSGRCLNTKLVLRRPSEPSFVSVSTDLQLQHNNAVLRSDFVIDDLLRTIPEERWRQVDQYKFENPVWSKTPADLPRQSIALKVREWLATTYRRWQAGLFFTTLKGKNVQSEIRRYLSENPRN